MNNEIQHGKKMYRMAWIVEWSLFGMAIALAFFNIMMGWDASSMTNVVTVILLSFGWVGIAFIELSTIPLAGGLALSRWRDKPLNFIAVVGLAFLSAFTVYEFNEAASYYMTRNARHAAIENNNDTKRIERNGNQINVIKRDSGEADKKIEKIKADYAVAYKLEIEQRDEALKQISQKESARKKEVERQIHILEKALEGKPEVVARLKRNEKDIQEKRDAHASQMEILISANLDSIAATKQELNEIREEEQRLISLSQRDFETKKQLISEQRESLIKQSKIISDEIKAYETKKELIKTGPFTGGKEAKEKIDKEKIRPLQDQLDSLRLKIEQIGLVQINDDQNQANANKVSGLRSKKTELQDSVRSKIKVADELKEKLAAGPNLDNEIERLKSIQDELNTDHEARHREYSTAITPLQQELLQITINANSSRNKEIEKTNATIEIAKQEQNDEINRLESLVLNKGGLIAALNENSIMLTNSIVERTESVDLASETVLYYRMAKWFQNADGLPQKEDYAKSQFIIFGPVGIFFGIVSVSLAYLGVSLTNRGNQERQIENQKNENKRNKQIAKLESKAIKLEEKCAHQALELVETRQNAFDAIKSIPQTFDLPRKDKNSSSTKVSWAPWITCVLVSVMCLSSMIYMANTITTNQIATNNTNGKTIKTSERQLIDTPLHTLMNPVVMVESEKSLGTGFLVREDGLIITNDHVVGNTNQVSIATREGSTFLGTVLERDESRDLALIKIDALNMPTLKIASPSQRTIGDDVIVIGTPLGLEWSMSKGIVSSIRTSQDIVMLQTDAAMNSGNSGGPLIHAESGKVIGINTLKASGSMYEGIGFAISSDEIRKAFPMINNEKN